MHLEQGLTRLFTIVDGDIKHPHYDRVVKKDALYMSLVTGEGLDARLRQVKSRESDDLFKQRQTLTEHITPAILSNVMDVYRKVPRARKSVTLEYTSTGSDNEKRLKDLNGVLSKFWGDRSIDAWFENIYLEQNFVNPNGFCVIEYESTDGRELASPYPFLVTAEDAFNFKYTNGILDFLLVRSVVKILEGKLETDRDKYTFYMEDDTVVLTPIPEHNGPPRMANKELFVFGGVDTIWLNNKPYLIRSIEHKLGRVQAFRIGFKRDLFTRGETFVAPYEGAVPLLLKTLAINSELDISRIKLAHPYPIRYQNTCGTCLDGKLPDQSTCKACDGTGKAGALTSGQDELVVKLPRNKEDMIDLTKLMVFVGPPVEVIKLQAELVKDLTDQVTEVTFNSDSLTRKSSSEREINDTATGRNIALQNLYDTLFTFSEGYADGWQFSVFTVAVIVDRQKDLSALMVFSRDFKLKDVSEMFDDLEACFRAGGGPVLAAFIQNDIAGVLTLDDPEAVEKNKVRDTINPWTGYSPTEIALALSLPFTLERDKILYLNMGGIFDEVELVYGKTFYTDFTAKKQREIVEVLLDKIVEKIKQETPQPIFISEN